jgi:hypothetical protein
MLNSGYRYKSFPRYKSSLDGYQACSVDLKTSFVDLVGFSQLKPLYGGEKSSNGDSQECNDFEKVFPPWLPVFAAVIGIIAVSWGWPNFRNNLRLPWSVDLRFCRDYVLGR